MLHSASQSIHLGAYVQSADPGAVGAKILWIDTTSGYVLKKRDATDTGWDTIADLGAAGAGIAETLIDALGDLIYGSAADTAARLAGNTTTTKKFLTQTGDGVDSAAPAWGTLATADLPANLLPVAIPFIIDGGGSAIATGLAGGFEMPFSGTITAVRVGALDGNTGSIVLDLWKDTYANFPPTVADTITASAKPTITTATKAEDTTLTGWTTSVTAGDWIFVNVDSVTTFTRVVLSLTIQRS